MILEKCIDKPHWNIRLRHFWLFNELNYMVIAYDIVSAVSPQQHYLSGSLHIVNKALARVNMQQVTTHSWPLAAQRASILAISFLH